MFRKRPTFESLLARLESQLKPEFAVFLRDMARHRNEKMAFECLVDGLSANRVALSAEMARDLQLACKAADVDVDRRQLVLDLAEGKREAAEPALTGGCSLAELVASNDPVAFGRANGALEVMIVRALREKFGLTLTEAVARIAASARD